MKFSTLVSAAQLAEHLHDPDWIVFDCRFTLSDPESGRRAYQANHIPGARYVHLNDDLFFRSDRQQRPPPASRSAATGVETGAVGRRWQQAGGGL